jgi:predicted nucleic acid-binding protein
MPAKRPYIYWDTCVFISFVQNDPRRIETLDSIVDESRRKEILIVTSMISVTEVAFAQNERPPGSLDAEKLTLLDDMWADTDIIRLVEFHRVIANDARMMMRKAVHDSRNLESSDAIHLATAVNQGVASVQTYDRALLNWDGIFCSVEHPVSQRPILPNMPARK